MSESEAREAVDEESADTSGDADESAVPSDGKPKVDTSRSETSYPAYSLNEAIRFGGAVLQAGGNEARDVEVAEKLGLKNLSSRAWTYRLGAARAFGIVERVGRGAEARIRITDLFKRINLPDGDADLRAARMHALLKPELYVKLVERYGGAPVPEAKQVANVLVRDHKIKASVADDAAEAFIQSLRDAGAVTPGGVVMATSGANGSGGASTDPTPKGENGSKKDVPVDPPRVESGTSRTITLSRGDTLTISASIDVLRLPPEDRKFVFEIIDKFDEYEGKAAKTAKAAPPLPVAVPPIPVDGGGKH